MDSFVNLDTPITDTVITTYNKFLIKSINVELNSSATIIVLLYPVENSGTIVSRIIVMSGTDYANWGNDDNYLIEFIKQQL